MQEIADLLGYSDGNYSASPSKSWKDKMPLPPQDMKDVMNAPFCSARYFNILLTSGMLVFAASMRRYFFADPGLRSNFFKSMVFHAVLS